MRYLAPGATTWQKLGSCHLTADMTCATGHFTELLQRDMTCDYDGSCLLLLPDVRAEETSGGRCGSAPWVEVATSQASAELQRWDVTCLGVATSLESCVAVRLP